MAVSTGPGPARGVLRHADAPGAFHHARIAPRAALAQVVQHVWIVRWDLRGQAPQLRETLPHPNVHLVFDARESRVYGIHSARFATELKGRGGVVGVKFRPGALQPFLQGPVSALRDTSCPPDAIFGPDAAALERDVLAGADDAACTAAIETFLLARLPAIDDRVRLAGDMVDGIAADRAVLTVDDILARWPLSRRALQRLFSDYVGIGAKWVINRYRLHEALERIDTGQDVDWARLALDLGYFDQAHFIREFSALVGCPPARYAARPAARRD